MSRRAIQRALVMLGAAVAVLGQWGCAEVAPYERGRLAHPTMQPDDAASLSREHVQAIQEGAAGGALGATSGCGCN